MFLGIGSYTFPWSVYSADNVEKRYQFAIQLLKFAAENSIRYVQFGDNLPLHEWDAEQLKECKRNADNLNIQVQVGTRRLKAEHLGTYISIAGFFGSPFLRIVIDDEDYHPSIDEVIREIELILPELQNNNIVLAIENHDRFPAKTLEKIILTTSRQFVGICLDTANSLGAGEGIEQVQKILAPYTVNLHVKDFTIRRVEHKMGFIVEGVEAGAGILDIPSLLISLQEFRRCETATLEVWSNRERDLETSTRVEKMKVERSLEYLKSVML